MGAATTAPQDELYAAVRAWHDDDPDPTTRSELETLLIAAESGDARGIR